MPANRSRKSARPGGSRRASRRVPVSVRRAASSGSDRRKSSLRVPTSPKELNQVVASGEGPTLEFKQSTGKLKEGLQTICAFLNGTGGLVLFGVRPDGRLEGQQVSDSTLRDIAQALAGFEPPVNLTPERLPLSSGREIIILSAEGTSESVPFTYDGRAYERVGSTTRKMSQEKYEKLLLERGHAKRRWENLPAEDLELRKLDRAEILRTRELAIQQNRIPADTSRKVGDILDRLGLRRNGVLTQAAQVLYGTNLMPDYPQCHLKMGRFRGTKVTGDIVDNRQEHLNAFAVVREGIAFLERTMPLGARFPKGRIFREDRFPVPLSALREILLNAVMHREYSNPAGYIAIAVFDDRIEIGSYGCLPAGITLDQLAKTHLSRLRNPLIAEAFHRTGAVECWGRGTNRVIDDCRAHGVAPPTFEERQGFLIVTFRASIADGATVGTTPRLESQLESQLESRLESLKYRVLDVLDRRPMGKASLAEALGQKQASGSLHEIIRTLLADRLIERTIPDKPKSRLQRYRTTSKGLKALKAKGD